MRPILLILLLVPICSAQRFSFAQVDRTTVISREQHPPATQEARRTRLRELFIQAGCTHGQLTEEPVQSSGGVNLICRLGGRSGDTIIIGANYNQAVPDNWAAASLLPSLYQSLAGRKRHHTFIFVAFADGAADLAGSRFFAEMMGSAEIKRTEAMVDLDVLGFSPTKISSNSDKDLVKALFTVVYVLKEMASQVDITKGVHVDAETFSSLNVPEITLHSLTQGEVADLQTEGNTGPAKFRPDFYYSSYRLISGYLAYLDEVLKRKKQ
jgi:hypothetical protein